MASRCIQNSPVDFAAVEGDVEPPGLWAAEVVPPSGLCGPGIQNIGATPGHAENDPMPTTDEDDRVAVDIPPDPERSSLRAMPPWVTC